MRRHQKLQTLSREHHSALQLALKAKRAGMSGDQTQIKATAATCVAAYYAELGPHFTVEENILLPLLRAAGEDKLVAQVECDHKELRRLSVQLGPVGATLRFATYKYSLIVPVATDHLS